MTRPQSNEIQSVMPMGQADNLPEPITSITDDPYVYMRDHSGALWFVWDNPAHVEPLQRLGWTWEGYGSCTR